MDGTPNPRRMLLVGDTTLDPLAAALTHAPGEPTLEAVAAPYGQVYQILMDPSHPAWRPEADYLAVWTSPQLTLPSLNAALRFQGADPEAVVAEAKEFAAAVAAAAQRVRLTIVPSWILPAHERWIQSMTWRQDGIANLLARANLALADAWAGQRNILMLDAAHWQASLSKPSHDPRMYAVAKVMYAPAMFGKAAAEFKAALRGALGRSRKVIVCDLDNTLWGGILGEDGAAGIRLQAPDPVGECFAAAQQALKALRNRGVLLAICSKNDEDHALSLIDDHPGMGLRRGDFAAWRINWDQKADNLRSLAAELNLGLDSFVFLDDSPEERDQVRALLPDVLVPDFPASPAAIAPLITALDCFETTTVSAEDAQRTAAYRAERDRRAAASPGADVNGWLASLGLRLRASLLDAASLPRAAQLLNKTNQFNLTLRRMEEGAFAAWASRPGNSVYVFHIADRFGDFGLAALASLSAWDGEVRITDFVMSCRVMGKRVEEAILAYIVERARELGSGPVVAPATEGPRNEPARRFFAGKYNGAGPALGLARISRPEFITVETTAPALVPAL
jgi:FkbH-like protein